MYPYFSSSAKGLFSPFIEIDSPVLGRTHQLGAYLSPGYEENTLKKAPVLFMQDGKNLFLSKTSRRGASGFTCRSNSSWGRSPRRRAGGTNE